MKLSWRDVVNTLLLAGGGAILYARMHEYSWWLVGGSWRWAMTAMGILGIAIVSLSLADVGTHGIMNRLEAYVAMIGGVALLAGIVTAWQWVALSFAGAAGLFWLVTTARNFRRSLVHGETPTQTHHGAFAH